MPSRECQSRRALSDHHPPPSALSGLLADGDRAAEETEAAEEEGEAEARDGGELRPHDLQAGSPEEDGLREADEVTRGQRPGDLL